MAMPKLVNIFCSSRESSPCPEKGLEFPGGVGGGGSVRPKDFKKNVCSLNEISRGAGLRKIPYYGGGVDIFWNYTFFIYHLARLYINNHSSHINLLMTTDKF